MTDSICELSFSAPCYRSSLYYEMLSDRLTPVFVESFLGAWTDFYSPTEDEIEEVYWEFARRTAKGCQYPKVREAVLDRLKEIRDIKNINQRFKKHRQNESI